MNTKPITTITVEALINAPVEKVWIFWTQPEHITQWNFASDDWQCPRAEVDCRTGGKFALHMEAKDGSYGFDFEGVYDEVVEGKSIAYSMVDGRKVLILFSEENGKTRIVESFDAESENSPEMQRAGWQSILNNFMKYMEAN